VRPRWEDLAARARGLGTHLLGPGQLATLAAAADLPALGDALRAVGFLVPEGAAVTPHELELAVRRRAADRLHLLARWAGARSAALAVIYEDEDRRSLRAILRGAAQGAPPEERLRGLIPTPALPERALAELARQATPGPIAALLRAWGNPYGPALLPDATATHPDLLKLEAALTRTFAARALANARAAGSSPLVEFVRETIDLENAGTALALAAAGKDFPAAEAFLEGGARLSRAVFLDAAAAGDPGEAGRRLANAFRPGGVARAIERNARDPAGFEEAILRLRAGALEARLRRDPLGPGPLLAYALKLRREVLALCRVIWGVALGAPRAELVPSSGI
jgi:vacuolar-type H+-ATPase subunit C/Vma6